MKISTRPSRPCTSANCTHSSACQLHSTLKLHCAFRFSSTDCRLVWCYPSSQRNWAAIKHRSVSWLTLSQDPPQEQEIHLSWQSSDGTTACIKSARSDSHAQGGDKNGNTVSPWFSAWTACRPGMFLWYRLGSRLSTVGFWAITLVFFKWSLPRGITWLLIDTKWFTVLLTEFWLPFNFKEGLWINKPSQKIDLFGPHLL